MATLPQVSENPATQRQYATQIVLTAALLQAVRELGATTRPATSPDAMVTFRSGVKALVDRMSLAVLTTTRDYYLTERADAGIPGTPRLPDLSPVPVAKIDAGLDWAERAMRDAEVKVAADMAEAEARVMERAEAALQKALMDEAREFTVAAVAGDEKAMGFRRVPRPDACYFCIVTAIRSTTRVGLAKDFEKYGTPGVMGGAKHYGVYKTRESAGQLPEGAEEINRYHNKCQCTVVPIFSPVEVLPAWLSDLEDLYEDTDGGLNEFRKALAAKRGGREYKPAPLPTIPAPRAQNAQAIADLLGRLAA